MKIVWFHCFPSVLTLMLQLHDDDDHFISIALLEKAHSLSSKIIIDFIYFIYLLISMLHLVASFHMDLLHTELNTNVVACNEMKINGNSGKSLNNALRQ